MIQRKSLYIHIILFLTTIITTLFAGSFQAGGNPFSNPLEIFKGIPFSFSLIFILLIHELGHYFLAKKHNITVTLPYFIPGPALPPPFLSVGTFGAFIKMKSIINNKNVLFDVGIAGPLLSFIGSLIALIVGLYLSEVIYIRATDGLFFGESLILKILIKFIYNVKSEEITILLHPIGIAGWFGFFVTFLNLIPIGQLDGGHIAYAVFDKKYNIFSKILVLGLVILGILFWRGWLFWALLLSILGTKHPDLYDYESSLSLTRKFLSCIILIIFILIFMPNPFPM